MVTERREQVFVSSTYVDLVEERQEVIQTLLEADCIPAGMELFPASDDDRWTLIKRVIDDSDYYIVVVGGRYGSVDPEQDISYTEMEFDYAVAQKKPILGFLHGDPGSIPADKTDLDKDLQEKLNDFRAKVGERMVKFWSSPTELAGQVAKSLIQIRKTHPAEGWVRARDAMTPEVRTELAELRARVAELTAERDAAEQSAHVLDLGELSQGDDTYFMHIRLRYWDEETVKEGRTYPGRVKSVGTGVSVSWNEIFAAVGPLMLDEATEHALEDALSPLAVQKIFDDENYEALPDDFGRASSLEPWSDVIHDVVVQFFALDLIHKSERRRQVSDKNTYWALTPRGRDQLMRLRAIRRPPTEEAVQTQDEGTQASDA